MLILYFGPELVAPAASVLAGIVGVLMLMGRRALSVVRRTGQRVRALLARLAAVGRG
jgi:hypothetical protein